MTYRHFNNETTRSSVLKAVADVENASAWQRLFDLYAGFVFSIARSKGLKDEDADDVVQIVFADLARQMPTFRYDRAKGRFRSYLIGLVHWRIKDRLRLALRDKELKANYMAEAANLPPADRDFAEREWQAATPAQIVLQRALGLPTPDYCHVPLVVGPDGRRLAKRHGDTRIAAYRAAGVAPERLIGFLAASCGWCAPGKSRSRRDLLPTFDLGTLPRRPFVVSGETDIIGKTVERGK